MRNRARGCGGYVRFEHSRSYVQDIVESFHQQGQKAQCKPSSSDRLLYVESTCKLVLYSEKFSRGKIHEWLLQLDIHRT